MGFNSGLKGLTGLGSKAIDD